jgi:hypothetical protein
MEIIRGFVQQEATKYSDGTMFTSSLSIDSWPIVDFNGPIHYGSYKHRQKSSDEWVLYEPTKHCDSMTTNASLINLSSVYTTNPDDPHQAWDQLYARIMQSICETRSVCVVNIETPVQTTIIDHNEQFRHIASFFGLTKTELGDLFSISRVTVYGWLKGEAIPKGHNANRIELLYKLIDAIPDKRQDDKIFRGYLNQMVKSYGVSTLELLKRIDTDHSLFEQLINILHAILVKSRQNFIRLAQVPQSDTDERSFEFNLRYHIH